MVSIFDYIRDMVGAGRKGEGGRMIEREGRIPFVLGKGERFF